MFIDHLLNVVKGAFLYPFKHAKEISVVYFKTLIIYFLLGYVAVLVTTYGLGLTELTKSLVFIINAILVLAVFMALMPLYVSVTRHVILKESFDAHVSSRILKTREVMTFVAWAKLLFVLLIPVFLAGLPMIVGIIQIPDTHLPDLGLGIELKVEKLILLLGALIGLYLALRASIMIIHAALDMDTTIGASLRITKSHTLLLAGYLVAYVILTIVLTKVLLMLYSIIGGPLNLAALIAMPTLGAMIVTLVTVFYDMLMGIIFVAGLAKIYLVITK